MGRIVSVLDADAALDGCRDLYAQLVNPAWMRLLTSWITENSGTDNAAVANMVDQSVAGIHVACGTGSVYGVAPDIGTMLVDAAHTIPSYTITAADAPSPEGFVHFTGGLPFPDINGKTVIMRAITWVTQMVDMGDGDGPQLGFVGAVFTDPLDPRDDLSHQYRTGTLADGIRNTPGMRAAVHWSPISLIVWPHGREFDMGVARERHLSLAILASLWRFVREPYVATDEERPSRAASKRAQRSNVEPSSLRVVRLRRKAAPAPEGHDGTAHYSHRFVVSGHWRNQWYPSMKDHRPRYIAPYVKGPEDRPLVVRDTVFTVDR